MVAGTAQLLHFRLEPGHAVDVAIANGLADRGCIGGFVMLRGGTCDPFQVRHAGRIAGRPSCGVVQRHLCA